MKIPDSILAATRDKPVVRCIHNTLVQGDPLDPSNIDLIAQLGWLTVGQVVPEGWRVLTGNSRESLIARVAYRYELED